MSTALNDSINDVAVDPIGNIAYEERFQHLRALRLMLFAALVLAAVQSVLLFFVLRRPPVVIVDRIDGDGHVQVSNYAGVRFTPRESEIRSWLDAWAVDRYRILKALGTSHFDQNYYFLSNDLARDLMTKDAAHVAQILAGSEPEEDVQINGTRFTEVAPTSGEAVIDMTKIVGTGDSGEKQRWTVTLRYEVDWVAAAKRAESDPRFADVNPLGVTITWFHEDRAGQ